MQPCHRTNPTRASATADSRAVEPATALQDIYNGIRADVDDLLGAGVAWIPRPTSLGMAVCAVASHCIDDVFRTDVYDMLA